MTVGVIIDTLRYIIVVVLIGGGIIEFVPVKISPLAWIGNRLNRDTNKKLEKVERELQEHIADEMRTFIIDFQNQCLNKRKHTKEEWQRAYQMCDKYEEHIRVNRLKNSEIDDAIRYIRKTHQHCLEDGDFIIKE